MTQSRLGGPGIGLPFPQSLYPVSLIGSAITPATNAVTLAPGQALPVPAGDYIVSSGKYSMVQCLDPVSGTYYPYNQTGAADYIHSDGQNFRVANLTGCPIGAVITAAGSGYVQASTAVNASAGGSVWQPIVGGALNTTVSIAAAGSGYTLPPLVLIGAPANPGVQATGYATIASGTVSGVTLTNQGAGYASAQTITLYPSPNDPNYGSVTAGTAILSTTGAGQVTAVLCTNNGAPQTTAPTLTISGVGTSASATATMCWTAASLSITGAGAGYGASTAVTSVGGVSAATPVWTNPAYEKSILPPRALSIAPTVSGTSLTATGTIYDGGIFSGTPTPIVITNGIVTTAATVSVVLGSVADTVLLQPI